MGWLSMATPKELAAAVAERYRTSDLREAVEGADAWADCGGGTARPPCLHSRDPQQASGDERCNGRPRIGRVREGLGSQAPTHAAHSLRPGIPIWTSTVWKDSAPGLVEAHLVAHSGPSARGSVIRTLVLTDIATG